MAEVELNVVCKHCGAEVSPYITECPYCGNRLRKRAPKLETRGAELAPKEKRGFFTRRKRKPRAEPDASRSSSRSWLATDRPYATIGLILAGAAVYLVDRSGHLGFRDLGAIVGPLDGDWWRLITAQFNYTNLGYLFGVAVATAIFGTSLERRYGAVATVGLFLLCGAVGMYIATLVESFPVAIGGNGAALGLAFCWLVLDLRDRRAGNETESDLLGFAAIAVVLLVMPALTELEVLAGAHSGTYAGANWWAGLGGAAAGALAGLALPRRTA